MNVARLADENIARFGEYTSLVFEDQEFTNVHMDRVARRLGSALSKLGVKKGDRVIVQLPNCPEALQSFQGVWKVGAAIVPISFLIGEEETAHIYQDSGAVAVIAGPDSLEKAKRARLKAPQVRNLILVDGETPDSVDFRGLVEGGSDELEMVEVADEELAILIYTAGTTGKPKGVMHSHYTLYSNAKAMEMPADAQVPPMLISLPLCHSYGIATMNTCYCTGAKIVLMRWFQVEEFFRLVEKHRPAIVPAVPMMYKLMLMSPEADKYDLSSVLLWISGSAALSLETARAFKEKFGATIHEGWGLTEAFAHNTVNPLGGLVKTGSIGVPMAGVELKVFDDDDRELARGEQGEIVVRGPMVMKGYWNMPDETAEALRNGWLHTGDIGYIDDDGYVFITERKKDMIIKAGENVFPREVEEVIMAHPKVADCAVVGVEDEMYGEDIRAFVVPAPGERCTEEEIIEHCRERLTRFKMPSSVRFVESLPTNIMGKVLRRELKKLD